MAKLVFFIAVLVVVTAPRNKTSPDAPGWNDGSSGDRLPAGFSDAR